MNNPNDMVKKSLVAQWAFDTRPVLGRFHLWLEDVKVDWIRGEPLTDPDINGLISFVDERTERLLIMTAAVTALGTKLFGRYGEGKDLDKKGLNQVKKDADAISAYAMSESLWYLSRTIPENHAIMVCLGEGLMPKAGETKEMGANPLLGFGRIYARPQVAKFLDKCVQKLINNEEYVWENFRHDIMNKGITVWGAAIDTLENTSRFAKGSSSGPMTVLNLFDQPLAVANQYEGYMGTLLLPNKITETAAKISLLVDFFTPREKIMEAIKLTYPGIAPENIHVWTLRGKTREPRIGKLWEQWKNLGVNLVEDDWEMPTGQKPFTESGTYAPSFMVGTWKDKKDKENLFIVDGYAASAEAIQAASLYRVLNLSATLSVFSSQFKLSYDVEPRVMQLDPDAKDFARQLSEIFAKEMDEKAINRYRDDILHASDAEIPLHKRVLTMDNFIAEKKWSVMAISGYMLPDPYSGIPGVQQISDDTFEVTARLSTRRGDKRVTFKLRLEETLEESQLVFQPLLNRFLRGEGFRDRPVKISDSGRIRNELQTLFSDALEHPGERKIVVYLDRIPPIIPQKHLGLLREILEWYKENHPSWFDWLEIA
jgi:hypothetical protein